MYCPTCGKQIASDAGSCEQCGTQLEPTPQAAAESAAAAPPAVMAAPQGAWTAQPPIPTYLVQSILATLFCCLPFGIVSTVYATQVNGKLASGDVEGAKRASANARTWVWISFGIGLVLNLILGSILGLIGAWLKILISEWR